MKPHKAFPPHKRESSSSSQQEVNLYAIAGVESISDLVRNELGGSAASKLR